jgi:uridine phosphorylase
MSFPNYPDKYEGAAVMRPEDTLAVRRRFGRFPNIEPPEALIFCLKNGLPQRLRWQIPVNHVGRVLGDFYLVRRSHGRVAVLTNFGIGAPVIASLAEEMVAFGVRKLVILSWGGMLQSNLNLGDIVICDRAIRDEGVSHHYLPAQKYVQADTALTGQIKDSLEEKNIACKIGATWTTDAPYRETTDEVKKYQSEGVQTVEMETAALFVLGQVRNVQTASVVIASDNLASLSWQRPIDMKAIDRSFALAYSAIVDVLSK